MTAIEEWDEEPDDYYPDEEPGLEPDDDRDDAYDDDDWDEPDPEDAEIARSYEEYYEHCEQVHGGEHCNCRTPLRDRLKRCFRQARWHLAGMMRRRLDEPPF